MPGVCLDGDLAGGAMSASSSKVFVNGKAVVLDGDPVAGHGDAPHDAATIVAGSRKVFVNGKKVVAAGDAATCGDVAVSSATNVNV